MKGDRAAFDRCVVEAMSRDKDNFMAVYVVPAVCGQAHIPIRQSCSWLENRLPARADECLESDLAFWRSELERLENIFLSRGLGGRGDLHAQGVKRCAEKDDEAEQRVCLRNLNWRTTMEFLSARAQNPGAFE